MNYNNMSLDKIIKGLETRNKTKYSALYTIYWINEKLKKDNKKMIVLSQSACYTYYLATKIVNLDNQETNWYYYDDKDYHKTWNDCNKFVEGYRSCLGL